MKITQQRATIQFMVLEVCEILKEYRRKEGLDPYVDDFSRSKVCKILEEYARAEVIDNYDRHDFETWDFDDDFVVKETIYDDGKFTLVIN